MKYTDIAWDFDGTLVDSYPNLTKLMQNALESFGCKEDAQEIRKHLVVTIRHARDFFAEKYGLDPNELSQRFNELKAAEPEILSLFPGIEEVLREIKESGRRNHLYTNRKEDAVHYMEELEILQYFDGLMTYEKMEDYKPNPDGMLKLLAEYEVEPSKMLMVGDRILDLEASKAVGADGCFFNTNRFPVPECADFVVEDIRKLLKYL